MPHLVSPADAHIAALMQWFPDAHSVSIWSASNAFPFASQERFALEAKMSELPSFFLVDEQDVPLAFGQYYERLGCCHVGRLVVAPSRRGEGLGEILVRELCAAGIAAMNAKRCSLFVMIGNEPALKLYRRLGFTEAVYPERLPLAGCLYMVREGAP